MSVWNVFSARSKCMRCDIRAMRINSHKTNAHWIKHVWKLSGQISWTNSTLVFTSVLFLFSITLFWLYQTYILLPFFYMFQFVFALNLFLSISCILWWQVWFCLFIFAWLYIWTEEKKAYKCRNKNINRQTQTCSTERKIMPHKIRANPLSRSRKMDFDNIVWIMENW